MSLHVLSPETVWNPGLLAFPTAPRKILERGMILPRREATWGLVVRVLVENQLLRYLVALLPVVIMALIWSDFALPIAQAPIPMLILLAFIEMRILRVPPHKREGITTEAAAARALDTLQFRGRRILTQLAARRGIENGTLFLVVEQSDLARVPPLTVASVQLDHGKSRLLPLTAEDRALIRDELFDSEFTERDLLLANLREDTALRSVAFEARGVSAHARLAAFLDNAPEGAPA
ncbi:MAG: hypothetical protein AAGA87_00470 [Pseudomonadota bacterium]